MAEILRVVIVKEGMPSVEQARGLLRKELERARRDGLKVLKVIHGYGSSGVGGDLRIALQATLRHMTSDHQITECIFGENWRTSNERTWDLLKRMPELKDDPDLGRGNKGFTMVVL